MVQWESTGLELYIELLDRIYSSVTRGKRNSCQCPVGAVYNVQTYWSTQAGLVT